MGYWVRLRHDSRRCLAGVARIPKTLMPDGPYYWNAYSIHGVDDKRRYLSLYPVPGPGFHDDAPDFHRIHCFR